MRRAKDYELRAKGDKRIGDAVKRKTVMGSKKDEPRAEGREPN